MKKAEKIRKTVTRISAGVIFACLLVMTLQISLQGTNENSGLTLSALTFGLFQPAMAGTAPGGGGGSGTGCIYTGYVGVAECNGQEILHGGCNTMRTSNGPCGKCGASIAKTGDAYKASCAY